MLSKTLLAGRTARRRSRGPVRGGRATPCPADGSSEKRGREGRDHKKRPTLRWRERSAVPVSRARSATNAPNIVCSGHRQSSESCSHSSVGSTRSRRLPPPIRDPSASRCPASRGLCSSLRLTHSNPADSIWYIPIGLDQKEVVMIEVFAGVALLVWTVLVFVATGDEAA